MSYEKNTWATGDVVTATKLNRIETGIENASSVVEGYYYNSNFYKESAHTTEITGETGKIYVDLSSNKTYRWSGSAYVEVSASGLPDASGSTDGTALVAVDDIWTTQPGYGFIETVNNFSSTFYSGGTYHEGSADYYDNGYIYSLQPYAASGGSDKKTHIKFKNNWNTVLFDSDVTLTFNSWLMGFVAEFSVSGNNWAFVQGVSSAYPCWLKTPYIVGATNIEQLTVEISPPSSGTPIEWIKYNPFNSNLIKSSNLDSHIDDLISDKLGLVVCDYEEDSDNGSYYLTFDEYGFGYGSRVTKEKMISLFERGFIIKHSSGESRYQSYTPIYLDEYSDYACVKILNSSTGDLTQFIFSSEYTPPVLA